MALLTVDEARQFLRLTDGTYDVLIASYIPLIEEDICTYLNTQFQDKSIYVEYTGGLAFVQGGTSTGTSRDYITDDNENFSTAGFSTDMDVAIEGGSNEGIYTIVSLSSGTMTMEDKGRFIDQDQDASHKTVGPIRISRIKWPESLKPIAAKMIWYQIDKAKPDGAIREQIDDYSVAFAGAREYPMQLINQLVKWKQARTH